MEETIIVHFPGHVASQLMQYRPLPGEGDDEVARRLSKRFAPGTVLGIDGARWRVDGPDAVTLVYDPIDGIHPKNPHRGSTLESLFEELGETKEFQAACAQKRAEFQAAPETPDCGALTYPVGSEWRPKDPRRKASFKVVKVEDGHVHTDDGRTIQLGRMVRYNRVD